MTPGRSPSRCPRAQEETFAYKPGQFLTLAVPSDQTGVAARCYSLSQQPARRRPAHGHGQAHRRRLRLELDRATTSSAGDTMRVLPPSGIFTPASLDADLLLFAGGSGITPVMSITRTALAEGSGPDRAVLRQPRRAVGDLRRASSTELAAAVPRPAAGRALARVGAGPADPGADEGVRRRPYCDVRRVRVRPGAVHEDDGRRAARSWSSRAPGGTRRSSSRSAATRSATCTTSEIGRERDHRRGDRRGRRRGGRRRGRPAGR